MKTMQDRWDALHGRLARRFPDYRRRVTAPEFHQVVRAYGESGRFYHTLDHIEDCLLKFDAWLSRGGNALPFDHDAVEAALWYHDIVYDPQSTENERHSAGRACDLLNDAGAPKPFRLSVGNLIMATKSHDPTSASLEEQVLLDIDLSILGAGGTVFDEYERHIRQEYAHVPDEQFRAGRRRILTVFDLKTPLYQTEFFGNWFEECAHANLKRSLAALENV